MTITSAFKGTFPECSQEN